METVEGVLNGACLPAELIAIDQSDQPNLHLQSFSGLRGCQIRYVHSPKPGASAARNLGARLAAQDVLLFLDDDLTVDRSWLSAIMASLSSEHSCAVITGQVREISTGQANFAPSCTTGTTGVRYTERIGRDILYSGNMAIRRSDFEAVGGFDERLGPGTRFPAAEDNDLAFRLLEAGYEIEYLPKALAWHRAWRGEGELVRLQRLYGRGQGAFYAKHFRNVPGYITSRLMRDVARPIRSLPERFRSRRLRRLLGDFAYAAAVMQGAVQWLAVYR
jgi:GT2 family glycosyltransferase